jgi:3-oxoacyl-[acyl-carrier protein] reductase
VVVDVLDDSSVETMIAAARDVWGGLDVLVTVVGGQSSFVPFQPLHETSLEAIDLIHNVNTRWVFVAVRAAVRVMRKQPTGGAIVSVGAISSLSASPGHAAYGSAKAGLANLAKTVAFENGDLGIRMNVVAPGSAATPAVVNVVPPEVAQLMYEAVPLGRQGKPEEVAAAIAFLASPLASYITGQQLCVDGGASVRHPLTAVQTKAMELAAGASQPQMVSRTGEVNQEEL